MEELFHSLSLWDARHALASVYSRGMRQKLSLIRALVHNPDLLILDEPVSGLDPFGIREVRNVVGVHREQGGAVLISSHILSEIERSADRIGILNHGRLLVEDTISGIRSRIGESTNVQLRLVSVPDGLVTALEGIAEIGRIMQQNNQLTIQVSGSRDVRPDIFQAVVAHDGIILEMATEEISLEEAFVTITHQNVAQLAGAA